MYGLFFVCPWECKLPQTAEVWLPCTSIPQHCLKEKYPTNSIKWINMFLFFFWVNHIHFFISEIRIQFQHFSFPFLASPLLLPIKTHTQILDLFPIITTCIYMHIYTWIYIFLNRTSLLCIMLLACCVQGYIGTRQLISVLFLGEDHLSHSQFFLGCLEFSV